MNIKKIETKEEFTNLNVGDSILVQWCDNYVKHWNKCEKIMFYRILENKEKDKEIICKLPENHYFNWERYLQGLSGAEEVYLVNFGSDIDVGSKK